MLLMHVTKDNKCAFCGSSVVKCANENCQQFFHAKNKLHIYHASSCKMRDYRRRKKASDHAGK